MSGIIGKIFSFKDEFRGISKLQGVYKIFCTGNNKIYIGSSNNLYDRLVTHRRTLRNNYHTSPYMQNSFNKYGIESFYFEILEVVIGDRNKINEREQYWLDFTQCYNPEIGFNTCRIANSCSGRPPSDKNRDICSKNYIITDPNGNEFKIRNLSEFCRNNNLNSHSMDYVNRGIERSHKGWHCRPDNMSMQEWEKSRKSKLKPISLIKYEATDPQGIKYKIYNMNKFSKNMGISSTSLRNIALKKNTGKRSGWQCQLDGTTTPEEQNKIFEIIS